MSKSFDKTFIYKEYEFNITVFLNDKVEKEHRVRINCMNFSNFYENFMCKTLTLEDTIALAKGAARNHVHFKMNEGKTMEEIILMDLGFK